MKKLFAILILCMMLFGCSGGSGGSSHDNDGGSDNGVIDQDMSITDSDTPTDSAPPINKPFVWNQSNWDEADWQ